jgi:hypothetical protein
MAGRNSPGLCFFVVIDRSAQRRGACISESCAVGNKYDVVMDQHSAFGHPEQWADFRQRNQLFLSRFATLLDAFETAFNRDPELNSGADRAVFFLGRMCLDDFAEILTLAENGYGLGAIKLVRGLYERAVISSFLMSHPQDADAFWDSRFVSRHKTLGAYVGGGTPDEAWIEAADRAKTDYRGAKKQYESVDDKRTGRKSTDIWPKLDFVTMAKATGDLGKLLGQAYYVPLNHAHGTAEGVMTRLKRTASDEIEFDSSAQPGWADTAVQLAHAIVIQVLEVQQKHFGLSDLIEQIEACANDLVEITQSRNLAQDPRKL